MKSRIAGVVALALLAACQTPYQEGAQMGVRINDQLAPNARIQFDQVVILDKSLQNSKTGKIAVEQQGARRTETGTLKVVATFRNRTDFPQVLEIRTSFFDSAFAPTEQTSAWSRVFLVPSGIASYEQSSMAAQAVAHYYIEVKESN